MPANNDALYLVCGCAATRGLSLRAPGPPQDICITTPLCSGSHPQLIKGANNSPSVFTAYIHIDLPPLIFQCSSPRFLYNVVSRCYCRPARPQYAVYFLQPLVKSSLTSLAASTACAQTSSSCNSNICYALNIPESTANSGSGDIFFQITAPSSYSWVGLGQGSSMSGSNMFVMYTSADGSNVTVSPRLGTGHNMPQFNSNTQITLLEGSGVSNGQMTANVRCKYPLILHEPDANTL